MLVGSRGERNLIHFDGVGTIRAVGYLESPFDPRVAVVVYVKPVRLSPQLYVIGVHLKRVKLSPASKVVVQIMDGHCTKQAGTGCTNPMLEKITKALPARRFALLPIKKAKSSRVKTEVWYAKGKQEVAERLVREHLAAWVQPADVKEWTWGGKFQILIVAAPGGS